MERIEAVVGSAEVYDTIERAWRLHRRHAKARSEAALKAKFEAMEEACDELDRMTGGPEIMNFDAAEAGSTWAKERKLTGKGEYPRTLYEDAMRKVDSFSTPKVQGKRLPPEEKWKESRLEGLIPREAWVPVDRKGQAWNYDWQRPSSTR